MQCNAIAHVHFDGAQLNPPAATTAQELEALLGTKPSSSAIDHIGLCVGPKLDMQFNDNVRVYKYKDTVNEGNTAAPQNCVRV